MPDKHALIHAAYAAQEATTGLARFRERLSEGSLPPDLDAKAVGVLDVAARFSGHCHGLLDEALAHSS